MLQVCGRICGFIIIVEEIIFNRIAKFGLVEVDILEKWHFSGFLRQGSFAACMLGLLVEYGEA